MKAKYSFHPSLIAQYYTGMSPDLDRVYGRQTPYNPKVKTLAF